MVKDGSRTIIRGSDRDWLIWVEVFFEFLFLDYAWEVRDRMLLCMPESDGSRCMQIRSRYAPLETDTYGSFRSEIG